MLAVDWSPDGGRLATGHSSGTIRIWAGQELSPAIEFGVSRAVCQALSWAPDGGRLASTTWDAVLRVWDPARGEAVWLAVVLPDGTAATFESTGRPLSLTPEQELSLVYVVEADGRRSQLDPATFRNRYGPAARPSVGR